MFVLIFILSYLLGVVSTIAMLFYLYTQYILCPPTSIEPNDEQHEQYAPFHPLPENERAKNSAVDAVNYLFQFLFQEMKDSSRLRRYIMHKLNTEFNELKNSRTGRIFLQNIVIESFSIGKECPIFSDIQLEHQERDERHLIKEFIAKLNVDYKDGFSVKLDVTLVFGQKCQLSIKVKRIQGQLRLEMRREPFCHWLLVFQDEPIIDFEVKSYLATRESPQLANIVIQQLRRAIRRKQTWPSYKIRYQPFFSPSKQSIPTNLTSTNGNNLIPGLFVILLKYCDRLSIPLANFDKQLFLTVSMNPERIEDFFRLNRQQWITKEIELIRSIHKMSIKEVSYMDRTELLLDQLNPIPQTIDDLTGFKVALEEKNVFILKIQGLEVKTIKQIHRVLKGKAIHTSTDGKISPTIPGTEEKIQLLVAIPVLQSIRVQRLVDVSSSPEAEKSNGTLSTTTISRAEASSPTSTTVRQRTLATTVKFDKSDDSIALNSLQSDGEDEQLSTTNTGENPTTKSQPELNPNKKLKPHKTSSINDTILMMMDVDLLQQFQAQPTTTKKAQAYLEFNEKFDFQVNSNQQFLNICLWCKPPLDSIVPNIGKKLVLLGYTTVALSDIVLDAHLSYKRETQMTLNFRSPYSPKPNLNDPLTDPLSKKRAELSTHKAYDDNLAHGFITIRIKHRPEIEEKLDVQEKKEQFIANGPILTDVVKKLKENERKQEQLKYINAIEVPSELINRKPTDHIFEDQTFPSATLCACCHRKIWMKAGRRCRDCHAAIHRKCQEKFNLETPCTHEPIDTPSKLTIISDDDIKSLTNSDTISINTTSPSDDGDTISIKSNQDFINRTTTANRLSTKAAAAFSALDSTARRSFRAFGHKNANVNLTTSLSPNLEQTSELSKSDEYLNGAVIIPSPIPTKRHPPPPPPPPPAPSKLASAASSAYSRLREFKTKRLPIAPIAEAAASALRKTRSPSDSTTSENISESDLRDIIKKCLSEESNDCTSLEHLLHERAVDDTALYAKAREFGPELFLELASDERKQRLDNEISRLQQEIDLQCQIRDELTHECNDDLTEENEKRKLRAKIANIDEKVQALGALTILYCSGLKHWRAQMESQSINNNPERSPDDDDNDELNSGDDQPEILTTSGEFSDVIVQ